MSLIQVTDNSSKELKDISESDRNGLYTIANIAIGNLSLNDNPNLLVFPRDLDYYGDKIGESQIITVNKEKIFTGNVMGFVGVNDMQLDIKSRFAKDCPQDYFLHYMLQKVFSINLFDIKHTISTEPIFDFLLYLFPHYLKKAMRQGIFKQYQKKQYNNANVRGVIYVSRHIRENIPFRGTISYDTREHSYDNKITQLVRHTIEYIRQKPLGKQILQNDADTISCVSQIVLATPSYAQANRHKVIHANIRPTIHPYFVDYTPLQRLCIQILRHETIKYGQEKDKVYGILFDGAWLWEEYLATIFKEKGVSIIHAKNKTGENGISLYEHGTKCYYPDFYYRGADAEKSFVLDAKYKRLNIGFHIDEQSGKNTISINRNDLFQMITYMHVLPAMHCALLYPLEVNENVGNGIIVIKANPRNLNGFGGEISGYGLRISKATEMETFWSEMKATEDIFSDKLQQILC